MMGKREVCVRVCVCCGGCGVNTEEEQIKIKADKDRNIQTDKMKDGGLDRSLRSEVFWQLK